ncbi:MAG: penicillin-binding protein 1C, partial [Saprospiraceae bacterium]|nr:penicillin-binding protein 1C [Saprospiraceae bacterium]
SQLFNAPTSTVLFDKNGELLGAKIASDGQWRFPSMNKVPKKFEAAIVTFEDKRFYKHWGIDIWAFARAIRSNIGKGKRVSGGSTLSMQTIRLHRKNPPRTLWEKFKEVILATRMEWSYSKQEILCMYASHAPFGGNVVGLDAAAWKYFGRSADKLSWAESSMLAVLPNSPSLIHLGKNREKLKTKRDYLLDLLYKNGKIDSLTCELAKLEELPAKPKALPRLAPHLLERAHREMVRSKKLKHGIIHSTLDSELQTRVSEVIDRHYHKNKKNEIHNAAALVVDVATGDIIAYVGNAPSTLKQHGSEVDIVPAHRSSGSILKPFLYAAMLNDGEILPQTIFPDIPTQFGNYTPQNYDKTYAGAVSADQMVTRSLNIPAVHMLKQYTAERFRDKLQDLGMTTLTQNADHYGLSLILGGAETSLWDLGSMYVGMTRGLRDFYKHNGLYESNNYRPLNYLQAASISNQDRQQSLEEETPISAAATWFTFEAMKDVVRPDVENFWQNFVSSNKVAWKTGTSFGFRDAWAVGCTPRYVVAVWGGNADGEGRPGLVGVQVAAPMLFDIFHVLGTHQDWFEAPYDEMTEIEVCAESGYRASEFSPNPKKNWVPNMGLKTRVCPYSKNVHLDAKGEYQVHSDCYSPSMMLHQNYFILPPVQEWYYKKKHPSYSSLPPYRQDCRGSIQNQRKSMAFIYPDYGAKIYVPVELDETKGSTVFEATHTNAATQIHWHLDDTYLGATQHFHQMALNPSVGKHIITIVDEKGESIKRSFEILPKDS